MTLIVEDGSIVEGANTYVTEAELTAYASVRGVTIENADREKFLTLAMDYLESLDFKGIKTDDTQPLQFPRKELYIDNVLMPSDEIPLLVKQSQMETAISISQGYNPLAPIDRAVKRERVYGAVEIEYMDNASSTNMIVSVDAKLKKLLKSTGFVFFKVYRI